MSLLSCSRFSGWIPIWSMDAIPRNPSYSASFSPLIFLLHYPFLISLYLWLNMYFSKDADSNPPPSNHPGSTGAGPWQLRDFTFTFPGGSDGKLSAWNVRDPGSVPGLTRSPGEGNDNSLQYSCLENPRDGAALWAAVCGVAQSRTGLKWLSSSSSMHNMLGRFWKTLITIE